MRGACERQEPATWNINRREKKGFAVTVFFHVLRTYMIVAFWFKYERFLFLSLLVASWCLTSRAPKRKRWKPEERLWYEPNEDAEENLGEALKSLYKNTVPASEGIELLKKADKC